jgi:hypothetical protein
VTVVALVPSAGPGAAADQIVVMPEASASSTICRADQVHVAVDGAGGEDLAVAGDDLGRRADDQAGWTPSIVSGLPALPIATIRPSRMPTSALTTPQWSSTPRR